MLQACPQEHCCVSIISLFRHSLLVLEGIQCHLSPLFSHEHSIQTKWNNLTPLKFDRKVHSSSLPGHVFLHLVCVPQIIFCKRKTLETGATPCAANRDILFAPGPMVVFKTTFLFALHVPSVLLPGFVKEGLSSFVMTAGLVN